VDDPAGQSSRISQRIRKRRNKCRYVNALSSNQGWGEVEQDALAHRPVAVYAPFAQRIALGVAAWLAMADRAVAAGHGGGQYPVLIAEFGRPGAH
jgi:hypothetical protein